MSDPVFSLSDLIGESLVDDSLFAEAYGLSADGERALMKTCIARLYDWYGPRKDAAGQVSMRWRSGMESVRRFSPVDFALVLFDGSFVAPARLLAALVPAIACGVGNVLAVRLDGQGDWPHPLLTAMELAGQELAADLSSEDVAGLLRDLAGTGASGVVIDLAGRPDVCSDLSRLAVYRPLFDCSGSIFLDREEDFDLEALSFAQPDTAFTVFGADSSLPEGFARGGTDFAAFLENLRDLAVAPANRIGDALGKARLVLGPGQEGCWVWPDLHPEFFLFHRTAWTLGD
ncbi:hypothetical protein LF599_07960 [Pseudodesulfovibrio thermohalotolerans]|uniref:hypothetical protein n=1 Tax=Pseudodesulfovibrio thermohalotolerans TaxID=2880651 RepID=UPI0024429B2F|nr:hypothetical protein [Pseudodesulfovibrio thermohalotolerans]WFS64082.1 hypothetical protein LF599_07960 [Pseudodesulfovibrio thermohalotolerans]